MSPHTKHKLKWLSLGALLGIAASALVTCCCAARPEMQLPTPIVCDAGIDVAKPRPVVPVVDAGSDCARDAGGSETDVVDAHASCGSHPWCKHPKECCTDMDDCCA